MSMIRKFMNAISNNRYNYVIDPYSVMVLVLVPLCLITGVFINTSRTTVGGEVPLIISSINSLEYRYILVGEITMATLLLVEAATDILSNSSCMFSVQGSLVNIAVLISLLIASGIGCFLQILDAKDHADLHFTGSILQMIFSISIGIAYLRWIRYLILENSNRTITTNEWNCTIYMALGIIAVILQWIISIIFNVRSIEGMSLPYLICMEASVSSF
eukprot:gene14164-30153_t